MGPQVAMHLNCPYELAVIDLLSHEISRLGETTQPKRSIIYVMEPEEPLKETSKLYEEESKMS